MPEIRDLTFSFGGKPVFSGLNLSLPSGSRTALLAPSGFGKTTLLRLLCGSLKPQSGSITGIPAEGIAMVFQEDRLLPGCTILENLQLVAPERPEAELTALLGELGLSGWEHSRPGKLSGGMRRRAAIARALVFASPLVIMDEPFKGLDEITLASTLACVDRWLGDRTFLLVTHSPQEGERLSCRITRLDALVLDDTEITK